MHLIAPTDLPLHREDECRTVMSQAGQRSPQQEVPNIHLRTILLQHVLLHPAEGMFCEWCGMYA